MTRKDLKSKMYWSLLGHENPRLPTWRGYIPALICFAVAVLNLDSAGTGPTGVENDFETFLKLGLALALVRMMYGLGFDSGRAYEAQSEDEDRKSSDDAK
jgi:hypothetical protein